ncbi:MAG: alpha/beta fold hydrolase [Mycolicibacterium sp.]|nr:alpha/beta fold hydrolase [Mycobacterium sp.]MCB0939017.1 alpha/beta fold hydrolase [Mycobacterium sp.]MCB9415840.1 alpha/beta fold hydrolase [Mycolicibacterium sp.]
MPGPATPRGVPPEPSLPTSRVRLTHRVLTLDGDQRVGVSVGGAGVPLVFLHGFGLNRRAYLRLLSRLGGLGFLVIAPDAAGHGETPTLPRGAAALEDRVRLTLRTLDVLGVRKAVFVGHSMGGRMIIDLAAHHPRAGAGRRAAQCRRRGALRRIDPHREPALAPQGGRPPASGRRRRAGRSRPAARRRTRGLPAGDRRRTGPQCPRSARALRGAARDHRFRGLLSAAGRHAPPPVADHRGTRREGRRRTLRQRARHGRAGRCDAVSGARRPPLLDARRAAAGGGHDASAARRRARVGAAPHRHRRADRRRPRGLAGRHAAGRLAAAGAHRGRLPRHRAGPPCRPDAPALQFGAASPAAAPSPRRALGAAVRAPQSRGRVALLAGTTAGERCTAITFVTPRPSVKVVPRCRAPCRTSR